MDDSFNAFAMPNGIVVVHSGALELLENEAQLAAVLGHEIAHATHDHTWRQQRVLS
jgi:predicted Zn-dependent protease